VAWRSALLGASEGDMLGDALHANSVALRRTDRGGAWACGMSERRSVGGRVTEWRVIEGMDGWWDGGMWRRRTRAQ